ncbi:MAG: glutamate synthase [Peptococcaceae bacterium BICA1-7]|nr:MAG: glutamate synthase [Peptococcaceae bacterium BICA1-7]HBV98096.1 glutamate synthase large subunit [Desulfotomaculum sp.]
MIKQGLYDPAFEHDACGVGFVCNIKGKKSNQIVRQGLEVLVRLSHRGATGADPETGDGAGILIQFPHNFFVKVAKEAGISVPLEGEYGSGLVFLPRSIKDRETCKKIFEEIIKDQGQYLLGWRKVPVDDTGIGKTARATEPEIEQIFIGRSKDIKDQLQFERKLYVIRKLVENKVRSLDIEQKSYFYIPNISSRTFCYKGLLTPEQVEKFFVDLGDSSIESSITLVHSRYSTNTFPTWDLAQPFRFLAHNGEINTLRGNRNWMSSKEGLLESSLFGDDFKRMLPTIISGGSDSAMMDNVLELLVLSGRPLDLVMTMLIPPAWEHNHLMSLKHRDFHKYHACLMEPWDGPAAMAFTNGSQIGAVLDRNGLRPARYIITRDDLVVMASEMGVLDIDPQNILKSGRLEPGKMFFIDTVAGKVIDDSDLKEAMASRKPYGKWLKENMLELDRLPENVIDWSVVEEPPRSPDLLRDMKAFGYTREDIKVILKPMCETGKEPVGAMGNDTPHAILSNQPQLLFNYFKQLFAQVTNPAIDPIREELVMSMDSYMGCRKNILEETPDLCKKLHVKSPVIKNKELARIMAIKEPGFKARKISTLFGVNNEKDFMDTLDRICMEADKAIDDGNTLIVLSDRGVSRDLAAVPALLAVGAVHQHLVKNGRRSQTALILESAEPREVNHFALLFAFGVGVINPYLSFEIIEHMVKEKDLNMDPDLAIYNYIKSLDKGIKKVLSKMGISTLQSYRGAQIYEALGLGDEVIGRCFTGTVSRIGGIGFEVIRKETLLRHRDAYPDRKEYFTRHLNTGGLFQWKRDGEFHLWNPGSISSLQDAARNNDYGKYKQFAELINDQSNNPTTLRGLLKFRPAQSVSLDEVEPQEEIVKRFVTGAMSFGSISRGAHEAMAIAMNRLGGKSNTGEGGEDPARFHPLPNGDLARSAIKQIASGRFGVTNNYLTNADEIQIKICQGAKPGEGGQLPGHKVSSIIARTRYTTPGVTLISPPPHHDIYSIEDLAQLIFDLKNVNPRARVSVKLVSEMGVGTVAAGVAKGHADMILISGGDGGTGASPISSIRNAGLPWELGLAETHQTLVLNDLRSRVRLQTDGQLRTGRDLAIASILGAEEYGFATAALIVLGCVMLRHCNLNNCSVGIATQNDILEKRFRGNPDHLVNYFRFVARDLREVMASIGVRKVDDLIGRTDLLEVNPAMLDWKRKDIDYSKILHRPQAPESVGIRCTRSQDHGIDQVLDRELIRIAGPALSGKQSVKAEMPIKNVNRTTGAMLSGEVCRIYGEEGLLEDTIAFKLKGVAGQSFGAWLARGVTFELEGMANDYVGKGISGGKIIIYPDKRSTFAPEENIIIGNTTFYGAISGEAYVRGMAGERFGIRNSGLNAVVEGVGDHGCEYMTGGRIVVIGKTGRNFAAGMSGGIAYVYDTAGDFKDRCNLEMVELDKNLTEEDLFTIRTLLHNHYNSTGSDKAEFILEHFADEKCKFVKVMPLEYKKILETIQVQKNLNLTEDYDG